MDLAPDIVAQECIGWIDDLLEEKLSLDPENYIEVMQSYYDLSQNTRADESTRGASSSRASPAASEASTRIPSHVDRSS